MQQAVLILDFDVALAGLIARTLRSQQLYCVPVPCGITLAQAQAYAPCGLILAARHGQDVSLADLDFSLLESDLPVLALGGTVPALCAHYGGRVANREGEDESVTLSLNEHPLFEGITGGERVLHDMCDLELPEGLQCLATATERCIGFLRETGTLLAVQYPIERNDPDAVQLLHNFACLVCGLEPLWTEDFIINQAVTALQAVAGEGHLLCAVSGGVDSAVCARLARMAVGDRLTCLFVDTGLFRHHEPQTVLDSYQETLGLSVQRVDAQESFLKALSGLRGTQEKQQAAARLLTQVYARELAQLPGAHTLVLGTNLNDVLYTDPPRAASGGAPDALPLCEPVRGLFKDEIRRLAKALSLPSTLAERQPFPAAGLALRLFGEVTADRLATLRKADAYFGEEIRAGGHERKLWQYFASMADAPDGQGGLMVVLHACQACSPVACASRLPYDLLERVTERILRDLPAVTLVMYDLTPSNSYSLVE